MTWPVPVVPIGEAAVGACLYQREAGLVVAVVVKATYALVPGGAMTRRSVTPLLRQDEHHDASPARSLRQGAEVVPLRGGVDVTFAGQAHAPGGVPVPAIGARFAVFREKQPLIDKTLHVYGKRSPRDDGTAGDAEPFLSVPMRHELALAGDNNPMGVRGKGKLPQIVDDDHPNDSGAGFGPISPYAKTRQSFRGETPRSALDADVIALPSDFDVTYFNAAPHDQRLSELAGDEWVVLDHLVPHHDRCASQLPRAHARAAWATDAGWNEIAVTGHGVHVDGEAGLVHVTWRGEFAPGDVALSSVRVAGGVADAANTVVFPDPAEALASTETSSDAKPAVFDSGATMTVDPNVSASKGARADPVVIFGHREALPIPQPIASSVVTYVDQAGSTVTLDAGARAEAFDAPFPVASPSDGDATPSHGPVALPIEDMSADFQARTAGMSADEQLRAGARKLAPFGLAAPGANVGKGVRTDGLPFGQREETETTAAPLVTPEAAVDPATLFHQLPRRKDTASAEPATPESFVPARTTEAIPITTATSLGMAVLPWQHRPPHDSITTVVKATFTLHDDGSTTLDDEQAIVVGDVHHDDDLERSLAYPSDLAPFKPRADVVLLGHAYPAKDSASGEREGVAAEVRFEFGRDDSRFARRLAVFGERSWEKALVTLGATAPAPFSSMPLTWERAWGAPGFDDNPVGRGRGALAADDGVARLPNLEDPDSLVAGPDALANPTCFAPISQTWRARSNKHGSYGARWLANQWPYFPDDFRWSFFQSAPPEQQVPYLVGDEPFLLAGVHREGRALRGKLPALEPRLFMAIEAGATGTVGVDYAFEEIVLRLDHVVFDMDAMKLHLVWRGLVEVSDENAPEIRGLYLTHQPLGGDMTQDEAHDQYIAELRGLDDLAADPAAAVANDTPGQTGPGPSVRASLEAEGVVAGADPPVPNAVPAEREPPTQAMLLAMVGEGGSVRGANFKGASLDGLVLEGAQLAGIDLREASLVGANLRGVDLRGALLGRANLSGADLTSSRLEHAELVGANLQGATLDGAKVEGVDATGVAATGASFRKVSGEGFIVTEGTLDEACFDEADLPGLDASAASLNKASLSGAVLTEALFHDATGHMARFDGSKLADAMSDDADFTGATFCAAFAAGSVWEGATLDDTVFREANLTAVGFVNASLERADLRACAMKNARMKRCKAAYAQFVKSDLFEAQMERSDLEGADFTGANLYGAETWKAKTKGIVLTGAIVTQTKLAGRA